MDDDCLIKIPPPKRPVVLKSGGPILELLDIDQDGIALVCWGKQGEQTAAIPKACLYLATQL